MKNQIIWFPSFVLNGKKREEIPFQLFLLVKDIALLQGLPVLDNGLLINTD